MSDIADFVDIPSAEYSALKERIALLERENADLKRENADLKHKLDILQHTLDTVQHKLDAVQHKLDVSCQISYTFSHLKRRFYKYFFGGFLRVFLLDTYFSGRS